MKTPAAPPAQQRWSLVCGVGILGLWIVAYLVTRVILERGDPFPPWIRIGVALIPIPPTLLALWYGMIAIRNLDEMQRRVHLEALAIAYPLAILLLVTLGFLQLAIDLSMENWSYRHVWFFLPFFYLVGLAFAWSRYR